MFPNKVDARRLGGRIILCILFLPGISGIAVAQNGDRLLRNVENALKGVKDYSVDLDVTSDIERMKVPSMHVKMYYLTPDRFHFESESFALLPREGLSFNVSRILARYSVDEVEEDTSGQAKQFKLLLRPRDERARATKLFVYIDPVRWVPTKIISWLFDGRTMTAMFEYEKQGGFVMPALLIVQFASISTEAADQDSVQDDINKFARPQMPRHGTVTVRYSNYEINSGLSDGIFDTK